MSTLNPDDFDGGLHGYGKGANLRPKSELAAPTLLSELEAELLRQDNFLKMLHGWTALPHIIGGAQRERGRILAAIEAEKRRSDNSDYPPSTST